MLRQIYFKTDAVVLAELLFVAFAKHIKYKTHVLLKWSLDLDIMFFECDIIN